MRNCRYRFHLLTKSGRLQAGGEEKIATGRRGPGRGKTGARERTQRERGRAAGRAGGAGVHWRSHAAARRATKRECTQVLTDFAPQRPAARPASSRVSRLRFAPSVAAAREHGGGGAAGPEPLEASWPRVCLPRFSQVLGRGREGAAGVWGRVAAGACCRPGGSGAGPVRGAHVVAAPQCGRGCRRREAAGVPGS